MLPLLEPAPDADALVPDDVGVVGVWPGKNEMLSPVLVGSEQTLVRLLVSLNATVADAALVQEQ